MPGLYVLTGDGIPFVHDGLRDGEFICHDMHARFRVVEDRARGARRGP